VYIVQDVDARVGEADRLVLLRVGVEGRVFSVRETTEGVFESYLRCLLSAPLLDSLTALGRPRNVPMWTEPLMVLAWMLE
jgi:hypothetical protein